MEDAFRLHIKMDNSPFHWECESLHVWDAVFNNVKNGSWCPSCARKQQSERQREKLEDLQDIASQRKGTCHSKAYTHLKDKYDWECNMDIAGRQMDKMC